MYAHAQAPVRIGIAGGGTDLPVWTKERIGRCLSLAIKSYTHAVAIARPDRLVVASYRKRDESTAATEIANGLIRESALLHGWEDSFEVHTLSELSSYGSGLGVSSSIAVSLAACFQRLSAYRPATADEPWRMTGKAAEPKWQDGGIEGFRRRVAQDAWIVEIDKLRRPIGRQDHMAAAHGGLRLYSFEKSTASVDLSFSDEDAKWMAAHLCLVKLPEGHDSRAILSGVKDESSLKVAAISVDDAVAGIEKRDIRFIGRALSAGHRSKEAIRGAVPDWLAKIVATIEGLANVRGCKVTGAGGGGHVVVASDDLKASIARIEAELHLPVVTVEADLEGVRSDGWA